MNLKKRRKRIRMILTLCGILLALYYILPAIGMAMEASKGEIFLNVGLLHLLFPLYLYISSIVLGVKYGFCSIYAVAAALLFLPTLLIYFTYNVWAASLIYGGIALAGNLMGVGIGKAYHKMKNEASN